MMVKNIKRSLRDILGDDYCDALQRAAVLLHGISEEKAEELLVRKIDFYPDEFVERQRNLESMIGLKLTDCFATSNTGAPTDSFGKVAKLYAAPISGIGPYRLGEDGRVYLVSKSEHYHTPLGHNFPGYKLISLAKQMGILNATHNNTRGYITRRLERELVRTLNGLEKMDIAGLDGVINSTQPKILNRVINLETGSLAVEAGIKMMLNRFYRLDKTYKRPDRSGKTPVFLVIADNDGGLSANYHGTTTIEQTFRGMWPEMYAACESGSIYKIVGVNINDEKDFEKKIKQYNQGRYKTAGFLHEIVLMNYGGIRLTEKFLRKAYELCAQYETPTLVDEIQSCMWYPGMYLFKIYGLKPDFVMLGKGFSGGEYPASKVVTTFEMDSLNQFGALVTNGQEELASLAYLITMEFAQHNAEEISVGGKHVENALAKLKAQHEKNIGVVEGLGHLAAIHFSSIDDATEFADRLNDMCIDISVQTYKDNCPPAVLIKPPFIMEESTIEFMIEKMSEALCGLGRER